MVVVDQQVRVIRLQAFPNAMFICVKRFQLQQSKPIMSLRFYRVHNNGVLNQFFSAIFSSFSVRTTVNLNALNVAGGTLHFPLHRPLQFSNIGEPDDIYDQDENRR